MSNRERAMVVAVAVVLAAVGAWLIFMRPEPYAPPVAVPAPGRLPPGSFEVPLDPAAPSKGAPVMDKKRHDQLLATLRAMYADAAADVPRPPPPPTAPPAPPPPGAAPPGAAPPPAPMDMQLAKYVRDRVRSDFWPLAKSCYGEALGRDKTMAGRVVIHFKIVGDKKVGGVVESADIERDAGTLSDPAFLDCITNSMQSVVFDAPPEKPGGHGGWVTVTYPFEFSPEDEVDAAK